MSAKKKTAKPGKKTIIKQYMDFVLEAGEVPASVYAFAKAVKIEEADFYEHFGSLKGLQKAVWNAFFEHSMQLLEKNEDYQGYGNREKMLSFFYTFFELLALNRSYVLFTLDGQTNMLKSLEQLKDLRKSVLNFATELIDDGNTDKQLCITRHNPKVFAEGAWLQTMFLLKFWIDDDSAGFEKTDMAIEKSVNTIFDVFDNTPLESIIDFGKFLFKENFA
ncbi:TetR family transcriptional regulator C-terminal domain-containing protein [Lentiprolixibacter aurantiacus]|uniref:TetR family transcriptional regulator C-terminal domain-containing protein n=1 Tax=Lentiprolixibacter aurantiacus TaxID=2993939 RepID=A0AAE3MMJ4_9FLAO|nr:TetR family transcriptional regulator C-terminal domain-containing protein [Lentiprolixibacter aurantiacus]MCX2720163.1 TetR family transcriptional regulator C-terminal domain-containing protein [Lentiprolixibacter aurantiacus]